MGKLGGILIAIAALIAVVSPSVGLAAPSSMRAGDYQASVLFRGSDQAYLNLNDLAWHAMTRVTRHGVQIDRLTVDRQERVAWTERFKRHGIHWQRLRVRTQAGDIRVVARHRGANAITALRFARRSLHWLAHGSARSTGVAVAACQRMPGRKKLLARNANARIVKVVSGRYDDDVNWRAMGCDRRDGRWRQVDSQLTSQIESSHPATTTGLALGGSQVAVSTYTSGFGESDLRIGNLLTGTRFDQPRSDYRVSSVRAIDEDGRYVFVANFLNVGIGPAEYRLVAGQQSKPYVELDAGLNATFTDVRIKGGVAYWTSGGVKKSLVLRDGAGNCSPPGV